MKNKRLFVLSWLAFLVSSASTFLVTVIDRRQHLWLSNSLAMLFWGAAIIGIVFCIILANKTKPKQKSGIRLFSFFMGKMLLVNDTILMLSIVCTTLSAIANINSVVLWGMCIFIDLFTLELHCLLSIKSEEVMK